MTMTVCICVCIVHFIAFDGTVGSNSLQASTGQCAPSYREHLQHIRVDAALGDPLTLCGGRRQASTHHNGVCYRPVLFNLPQPEPPRHLHFDFGEHGLKLQCVSPALRFFPLSASVCRIAAEIPISRVQGPFWEESKCNSKCLQVLQVPEIS